MPLFKSKAKMAQKTLVAGERLSNAAFVSHRGASVEGKTVLIIDDVITTGASVGACAELAYSMGAKRVIVAAIGIAYKDEYEPTVLF